MPYCHYFFFYEQILVVITDGDANGPGNVAEEAKKWVQVVDEIHVLGFGDLKIQGTVTKKCFTCPYMKLTIGGFSVLSHLLHKHTRQKSSTPPD